VSIGKARFFIMARRHVFCEVGTKFLYIIWLNLSLQNFKVKGESDLYPRHEGTWGHGRQFHKFLTSAIGRDLWLASRSEHLTLDAKAVSAHRKRTRTGPKAEFKAVDMRKILPVIEPRFICGPGFSLVTILTELHWLKFLKIYFIEYELEAVGRTLFYISLFTRTMHAPISAWMLILTTYMYDSTFSSQVLSHSLLGCPQQGVYVRTQPEQTHLSQTCSLPLTEPASANRRLAVVFLMR